MAGSLTLALNTAQSGLLASQQALDAVANNVANVNTPDYSRKIAQFEQRVVAGVGAGVQLSQITRSVDEGLQKSYRNENTEFAELNAKDSYFSRLQDLFGSPESNSSISHTVSALSQALEMLALSPDKTLEQSEVVRWASEISRQVNEMSETIQDLRLQAEASISDKVSQANTLAAKIVTLNHEIIRSQTLSHDTTDLEDQRDAALNQLSTLMDISYYYRNSGDVVVFTTAGKTIVNDTAQSITHDEATGMSSTITYSEGDIAGIYIGGTATANDVTDTIRGGELKGLIDLRDQTLPGLQAQLDELANQLQTVLNRVHNRGVPYPGIASATGSRSFSALDTGNTAGTSAQITTAQNVQVGIFDANGNQVDTKTLTAGNYWVNDGTVNSVVGWLNDLTVNGNGGGSNYGTVTVNSSGQVDISMNSGYYIGFLDSGTSANEGDAQITFDYTSDGDGDLTAYGFANFLGLNDLFTTGLGDNLLESQTKASNWSTAGNGVLTFVNNGGTTESVNITAGASLEDIADAINNSATGISFATASVVPDGSGFRLRVIHDSGGNMAAYDGTNQTIISGLGFGPAATRTADNLAVRSDIASSPSLLSSGIMQYDANLGAAGEYFTSLSDNTIATALAEKMTLKQTFNTAGGLATQTSTFTEFASSILSRNASLASQNSTRLATQQSLSEALKAKSDTIKGVNLDEEMSNLILYQQSYSASARIISVVQTLFDALEQALR